MAEHLLEDARRYADGMGYRCTCRALFRTPEGISHHIVQTALTAYVERSTPPPVRIENIDGQQAAGWLAEHNNEVRRDFLTTLIETEAWRG